MAKYLFPRAQFKAQGYTDEEIDKFLEAERAKGKEIEITLADSPTSTQTTTPPSRSLIASALPIIGGAGGFLVGGPLGGAAGAAIGETAAQTLTGEELNAKNIALNAVMGGIPFGKGASLLTKAILPGAAVGGVNALTAKNPTTESILQGAATGGVTSGVLGKILPSLTRTTGAAGEAMQRGSSIAPYSTLDKFSQQVNLQEVVGKYSKDLGRSGMSKFQNVEGVVEGITNQVDDLYKGVKETVSPSVFKDRATALTEGMSPTDKAAFTRIYNRAIKKVFPDKIPDALNPLDVNKIRRVFNKEAGAAFKSVDKGGVLSSPNQAVVELRDFTDDMLTDLAPKGIKEQVTRLNRDAATLLRGIPEFKILSEQSLTLPLVGKLPGSRPIVRATQAAGDLIGEKAQGLANLPPNLKTALAQTGGQTVSRASLGGGSAIEGETVTPTSALSQAGVLREDFPAERTVQIQGKTVTESQLKQARIDALASGNKAGASTLESIIKAAFPEDKTKPLAVSGANIKTLAQSGLRGLEEAALIYQEDPGVLTKQLLPGKFASRKFDSAMFRTVEALLRARSGAAVPEQEVRRYMGKYAPNFGDSPDVVVYKFQQLQNDFEESLRNIEATRGGSSLEDLQNSL